MVELEQVQRDYGALLGRVAGSYAASPADRADLLQEIALALTAAVRQLPLGLRQVLVLTLEGLPQSEIGEVLGLAENAVSVRLHRARAQLAARLGELHHERGARPKGSRHG